MSGNEYDFITFEEGVARIKQHHALLGISAQQKQTVITSRNENSVKLRETLKIANTPKGISKSQLPVYWEGKGAQFFISVAEPGAQIKEHSHSEGDGIRFIVNGSIRFDGQELGVGDWMFIPKGVSYSLEVGEFGATMLYCYQCCCVPK